MEYEQAKWMLKAMFNKKLKIEAEDKPLSQPANDFVASFVANATSILLREFLSISKSLRK